MGDRNDRRTALASGSGDHAELARLAVVATDAASLGDGLQEAALTRFQAHANPAAVLALIAVVAALRGENETLTTAGIIEVAVRNPSVADYVQHWEGRTTEAERKLAEAVGLLERIGFTPDGEDGLSLSECVTLARTFLSSKEAERG